jgi:quercetin 2,3-dioxygenase
VPHLVRRDADIAGGSGRVVRGPLALQLRPLPRPRLERRRTARVLNDDLLVPGGVWPMHPHRDVESLTWVVEGTFGHDDSLGNGGQLGPGGVQVMTFGPRGAEHSERNDDPGPAAPLPAVLDPRRTRRLENGVQQAQTTEAERTDRWLTIMSPVGEDGLDLQQDARVRVSRLTAGASLPLEVAEGRAAYLYVIDGAVSVSGLASASGDESLATGDALVVTGAEAVRVAGALPTTELWIADVPLRFTPHGIWAGHAH